MSQNSENVMKLFKQILKKLTVLYKIISRIFKEAKSALLIREEKAHTFLLGLIEKLKDHVRFQSMRVAE